MWLVKFIRKKLLAVKIPIGTVISILHEIDTDNDNAVSLGEIIEGIRKFIKEQQ